MRGSRASPKLGNGARPAGRRAGAAREPHVRAQLEGGRAVGGRERDERHERVERDPADGVGLALDAGGAEVQLVEPAKLEVSVGASPPEVVDFRDRVVKMALGHGHLVVATTSQCCVFQCGAGGFQNVPTLFDLKDPVGLILLGERHFLLVDPFAGVRVFTYDGRHVCSPKFQGLQPEFLTGGLVALADDAVAIVESAGRSKVRLFDLPRGRPLGRDIEHTTEIVEVRLNCAGTLEDRRVAFRDRNKDLFLAPVAGTGATVKLATMVDSLAWHAQSSMLAAVADRQVLDLAESKRDRGVAFR